ncbi:MAG: GYF domain-containing protein, partial [Pseudomonadota bacterium]
MSGTGSPTTEAQWYVARDGQQHGPLTDAEMRLFVQGGHLKPTDLIWKAGFPDWKPAPSVFPPKSNFDDALSESKTSDPKPARAEPTKTESPTSERPDKSSDSAGAADDGTGSSGSARKSKKRSQHHAAKTESSAVVAASDAPEESAESAQEASVTEAPKAQEEALENTDKPKTSEAGSVAKSKAKAESSKPDADSGARAETKSKNPFDPEAWNAQNKSKDANKPLREQRNAHQPAATLETGGPQSGPASSRPAPGAQIDPRLQRPSGQLHGQQPDPRYAQPNAPQQGAQYTGQPTGQTGPNQARTSMHGHGHPQHAQPGMGSGPEQGAGPNPTFLQGAHPRGGHPGRLQPNRSGGDIPTGPIIPVPSQSHHEVNEGRAALGRIAAVVTGLVVLSGLGYVAYDHREQIAEVYRSTASTIASATTTDDDTDTGPPVIRAAPVKARSGSTAQTATLDGTEANTKAGTQVASIDPASPPPPADPMAALDADFEKSQL